MLRQFITTALLVGLLLGVTRLAAAHSHEAHAQLASLINAERASAQLPPQSNSAALQAVAQLHANYMASTGNVTHYADDGGNVVTRSGTVGYPGEVNEIIFGGVADPGGIVKWWMNSPSHRDIIMTGMYTEIGIATATNAETGWTYWCVVFGALPSGVASADIAFTPIDRVDSDAVLDLSRVAVAEESAAQAALPASAPDPAQEPATGPVAVAVVDDSTESELPVPEASPSDTVTVIAADSAETTAVVAAPAIEAEAAAPKTQTAALGGSGGHTSVTHDPLPGPNSEQLSDAQAMTASMALDPVHVVFAAGALLGASALLLVGFLRPRKRRDQFLPPY